MLIDLLADMDYKGTEQFDCFLCQPNVEVVKNPIG
jgi:hypothetical protein